MIAVPGWGMDRSLLVDEVADELGLRAWSTHPTLDEYPRASNYVRFSRSRSVLGDAPVCGQDTDRVLAELAEPWPGPDGGR